MTFMDLYADISSVTLSNGSVIVSTVFSLHSHVNVNNYTAPLLTNVYSVFLNAGFDVDNSSISKNYVLNFYCKR